MMVVRERPSPNFGPRSKDSSISMLVLHYTGMKTAEAALERLCDPDAKVSAHYVVDEDGTIWRLVEEAQRAWHAGEGYWQGTLDINSASIGIEMVNPGHEWGYRPFPDAQMAAIEELCRALIARHPIPPDRVVGHSDVAPRRKLDPGELFDWRRLACAGVGLWPEGTRPPVPGPSAAEAQSLLGRIGYWTPGSGVFDSDTRAVLAAFQRRFRPNRVDGELDDETRQRLVQVALAVRPMRAIRGR